ncbi:MAG: HEAT repeat domain-containing protein [Chloroflexota bacterium]
MVSSQDPARRALGLKYIGKHRYHDAIDVCIYSLEDEDADVRAFAAWALDQLGNPETVPALIGALHDPNFGVRSNAGWALVHLARRLIPYVVVPDVIDILADSKDEQARQMAYLVLYHIGGPEANAAIERYW